MRKKNFCIFLYLIFLPQIIIFFYSPTSSFQVSTNKYICTPLKYLKYLKTNPDISLILADYGKQMKHSLLFHFSADVSLICSCLESPSSCVLYLDCGTTSISFYFSSVVVHCRKTPSFCWISKTMIVIILLSTSQFNYW